jgi:hypothetical protein
MAASVTCAAPVKWIVSGPSFAAMSASIFPVDVLVHVLLVGQVLEEDVDRGAAEVVGDEVLPVERDRLQLLLELVDLALERWHARQELRRAHQVRRRVDRVRDADHLDDAGKLRELVREPRDLLERRLRENVLAGLGEDADDRDVVAPERLPDLFVVGDLGVVRRDHRLDAALDPDFEREEPEQQGDREVSRDDEERVANEPPREGIHRCADLIGGPARWARRGIASRASPALRDAA